MISITANSSNYAFGREIINADENVGLVSANIKAEVNGSKVTRVIEITHDILERKKTALLLDGVLNSSISGIEVYKAVRNQRDQIVDFEFLLLNSIAEDFKGRKDLIGKLFLEEYPFSIKMSWFQKYAAVIETGITLNAEHDYNLKSHNYFLKVNVVKYLDGFVLTFENITEKKRIEKENAEYKLQYQQLQDVIFQTREDERKRISKNLQSGILQLVNNISLKLENNSASTPSSSINFTKRETEILALIAEGLTNNEIADKLFISRRTVEAHRTKLLDKTDSKNTASLIKFAVTSGIISL